MLNWGEDEFDEDKVQDVKKGGAKEDEDEEQQGHPPLWQDGAGQMGEGRRSDVRQSEGHHRESDRWSENHSLQLKEDRACR